MESGPVAAPLINALSLTGGKRAISLSKGHASLRLLDTKEADALKELALVATSSSGGRPSLDTEDVADSSTDGAPLRMAAVARRKAVEEATACQKSERALARPPRGPGSPRQARKQTEASRRASRDLRPKTRARWGLRHAMHCHNHSSTQGPRGPLGRGKAAAAASRACSLTMAQ